LLLLLLLFLLLLLGPCLSLTMIGSRHRLHIFLLLRIPEAMVSITASHLLRLMQPFQCMLLHSIGARAKPWFQISRTRTHQGPGF
jgi:hypothetical protein